MPVRGPRHPDVDQGGSAKRERGIGQILLASGLAEIHFDIAAESLRIANRVNGREVFTTTRYTVGDNPAIANNGRVLRPEEPLAQAGRSAAMLVIAGLEPEAAYRPSLATHLRRLDSKRQDPRPRLRP